MSIHSAEMLVAGIICLGMGILIIKRNPYLKISQLFLITMCMAAIYASSMFMLRNAGSYGMAVLFARLSLTTGVLTASSMLYFSVYPPFDVQGSWPIKRKHRYILTVTAAAILIGVLPVKVVAGNLGYWWVPTEWTVIWIGALAALTVPPVLFLNQAWDKAEDERLRRRYTFLSVALLFPFVMATLDAFLAWSVMDMYSLLPWGLLATSLIFVFTILDYRPFNLPSSAPPDEKRTVTMPDVILLSGHCDLVKGKKADAAYRMFMGEMESGSRGMIITNLHPGQVKERYGSVKAQIMWLSSQPGHDRLDPTALTIIQHTMIDFLQKGDKSVLLLDGLDHLISENHLEKVLKLIYAVHDAVVVSGAKLIVPIDPLTIDNKDLAFIEKEFVVIEEVPA